MRASLKVFLGLSTLLLAGTAQAAQQLVPVIPFPNASSTSVFGIADDGNTIAGSYVDQDGVSHGFYGTLDGNYTSFDFPGADSTQARAIDASGTLITGFANIALTHCEFIEWEYDVSAGKIKQIKKDGTPLNGAAQGLNKDGLFAGDYCDSGGTIHGQLGKGFKYKKDVNTGIASSYTGERAVNHAGTAVGFYVNDGTALQLGTIVTKAGDETTVTYPDGSESYTVFEGINDDKMSAGQWGDTGGIVHSFSYNMRNGKFNLIDDPFAASFTQAWGMNNSGLIAVTSDAGPYIYCPKARLCPSIAGAKAIVLKEHTVQGQPGATRNHAPSKHTLPKGASFQ